MAHIVPEHETDRSADPASVTPAPEPSEPLLGRTACPLCHTEIRNATALAAWKCRTCGQRWTPLRLATVASYAEWAATRGQSSHTGAPRAPSDGPAVRIPR